MSAAPRRSQCTEAMPDAFDSHDQLTLGMTPSPGEAERLHGLSRSWRRGTLGMKLRYDYAPATGGFDDVQWVAEEQDKTRKPASG